MNEIADALARGDLPAALDRALALWTEHRGDALAKIVLEIYARLPERRVIDGANHLKRWAKTEGLADPADLPRQAEYLIQDNRLKVVNLGLAAFAKRPPNPMLAVQLARMISPLPWRAPAASDLYHRALISIASVGTRAEIEPLRALATRLPTISNAHMRDAISSWIAQAIATLEGHAEPTLDVTSIATALAKHASRTANSGARTEELVTAVYANLADDAPRLVLADHLAELGDPRGELIALQCQTTPLTPKQRARVNKLVDTHYREWLAPIETGILKTGLAFERGFLARGSFEMWRAPLAVGHRIWSTLREATLAQGGSIIDLLDPVCVSLRVLLNLDGGALDLIETTNRVLPIETISVDYSGDDRLAGLADIAHLVPNLRELRLNYTTREPIQALLARFHPLDRIRIYPSNQRIWTALVGPKLRQLVIENALFTATVDRDDPTTLALHLHRAEWQHLRFDLANIHTIRLRADQPVDRVALETQFGVPIEMA